MRSCVGYNLLHRTQPSEITTSHRRAPSTSSFYSTTMNASRLPFLSRLIFVILALVDFGVIVVGICPHDFTRSKTDDVDDVDERPRRRSSEPSMPAVAAAAVSAPDLTRGAAEETPPARNHYGSSGRPEAAPPSLDAAAEKTFSHFYRGRRSLSGAEGRRRGRARIRNHGIRMSRGGGSGGGGGGGGGLGGGSHRRSHSGGAAAEGATAAALAIASAVKRDDHRNCTTRSCSMREEAKRIRLEVIKSQILQKLRLTHVPNITKGDVPRLPSPIEHMIGQSTGAVSRGALSTGDADGADDDDDFHATTTKVIKFGEKPSPEKMAALSTDASNTIFFEFQPKSLRAKVLSAQLFVYVRKPPASSRGQTLLLVYKMPPESDSSAQPELICHKSVELQSRRWNHWQSCDIKQTLDDWLHLDNRNFSLKVVLNDSQGRTLAVLHPDPINDNRKPFIQVETKPGGENRKKRMLGLDCDDDSNEERCCRYKLTVDFDTFGWDWILAPKQYEAYFCAGTCPQVFLQQYQHSHIILQTNDSRVLASGGLCCTPTRLSPVQLLYYDDRREIINGFLPDMAVDRCGCA